jgi:hypothetical protein
MPEHAHWLIDEYPSVSTSRRQRDRLLIALVREHGQPRYDYPPKLVRYHELDGRKHVETKKA